MAIDSYLGPDLHILWMDLTNFPKNLLCGLYGDLAGSLEVWSRTEASLTTSPKEDS
jgi:hypothetical protein